MTREQLWAQYAAAAISSGSDAGAFYAAKFADAMLAEHLRRFPQDQQEAASWEQQEGFEWMTVSGRKIPSWPDAKEDRQPDADGWIKWDGGGCPAKGADVDVKFRSGAYHYGAASSDYDWAHHSDRADIIAYRLSR